MPTLVNVIVRDTKTGNGVQGVGVSWFDQGGHADARVTDGNGFCNFGSLVSGGITIECLAPKGYNNVSTFKTDDDPNFVIDMEPSEIPFDWDDASSLHIEGRYFKRSNGTIYFYHGVSEFCLFKLWCANQGAQVEALVNERLSIFGPGTVFRTFRYAGNNNTFAMPPSWAQDRLDAAVEFCRYLKNKNARVDFTAGDAQQVLPNQSDQQHECGSFYEAISNEPNAFFQTCNEPGKNGIDVQRVKPPKGQVLRSSGNYDALYGDATFNNTMLDFLDFHSVRDGLDTDYPKAIWDPLEQMYSDYITFPIVNGEPFGFAEQYDPGRRSNKPKDGFRLAVERKMWDVGVTFHSNNGINGQLFEPTTKQCALQFARGLRTKVE